MPAKVLRQFLMAVSKTPTVIQCLYDSQKITLDVHSQPSKRDTRKVNSGCPRRIQGESTQQALINHFIPISAVD